MSFCETQKKLQEQNQTNFLLEKSLNLQTKLEQYAKYYALC